MHRSAVRTVMAAQAAIIGTPTLFVFLLSLAADFFFEFLSSCDLDGFDLGEAGGGLGAAFNLRRLGAPCQEKRNSTHLAYQFGEPFSSPHIRNKRFFSLKQPRRTCLTSGCKSPICLCFSDLLLSRNPSPTLESSSAT